MRLFLITTLLLAACGRAEEPVQRAPVKRDASAALAARPDVRVHSFDQGELRVLEVPVHVTRGGFVERQTCFVWRDTEFRTASLQCPAGIEGPPERAP